MLLLVGLFLVGSADAALYRPHVQFRMKNSSVFWGRKAQNRGPNICAEETIWNPTATTYNVAWSSGSLCAPTTIKFECCEGFGQFNQDGGCIVAKDVEPTSAAASRVRAGQFLSLLTAGGLQKYAEDGKEALTLLLPLDEALNQISSQARWVAEEGANQARRLAEAPLLLLSHVVTGRYYLDDLRDDHLLTPLSGQPVIRINKYPNGLVTANCVPIVKRNIETFEAVLHTISSVLPQSHLFTIADMVLRDVHARKFANFFVQSRLENVLRSEGPFTLFLPTDSAIDSLDHNHLHILRNDRKAMESLVLNHIVPGVQCSIMLNSAVFTTREGSSLRSKCYSSGIRIGDADIISNDRIGSNGVVHVVDKVLLPKRAMLLPELLKELGLTSFLSLVERGNLKSMLNGEEGLTVFAPTNKALQGTNHLNEYEARSLVLNHISSSRKIMNSMQSKGARAPFTIKYLQNKRLVDAAVMISPDNEGLNGVVHILDRHLVAPTMKSVWQYLQNGRFHYFLESARSAGVIQSIVKPASKVTVFAIPDSSVSYGLYYRTGILLNHIVERSLLSEEVPTNGRYVATTLAGSQIDLVRRGESLFIGSAPVMQRDILCSDGVVHIVGEMILRS